MKKFITFILMALLIFGLCSCDPYADQFNKMQKEINSLKERVERNEESIDILIANTDTEVARLRDYIENVSIISEGQDKEILEKIESLETVLETLKKNTDASDEDRIAEIEALEDELAELKDRVDDVEDRVTTLETLTAEINSLKERVEELGDSDADIIASVKDLADIVEDYGYKIGGLDLELDSMYTSLGTDLLTVKESILKRVSADEKNLEKIVEELSAKIDGNSKLLEEVGGELETIHEKIGKLDIRLDEYHHVNPLTGELEPHDWGDLVYTDSQHYRVCKVCGVKGDHSAHHWTIDTTVETCHRYCRDCGYSEKGEISHPWKYEEYDTTEAKFRENYPSVVSVSGVIENSFGGYGRVAFSDLPNLYRNEDERVFCDNCYSCDHKIMNHGDGTVNYLLTYFPELDIERYVEEAEEYMLRISDIDGNCTLYLRNYYVTREVKTGSDTTIYRWAVEEDGKMRYYKDGVLKPIDPTKENVLEVEMTGSTPLSSFIGANWDGVHAWGNPDGFTVGGDVYFMTFNKAHADEYDNGEVVSFKVTDGKFVEVNELDITNRASK